MMAIEVRCWPDETTRTPNSGCVWIAETTVDGRTYIARSRHGAPNALARQLAQVGLADRPMVIRYQGLAGNLTWRSFYEAAKRTYSEGDQPLHRARYKKPPEGLFSVSGTEQKCVSSPSDNDVGLQPLGSGETAATFKGPDTRNCGACGRAFRPSRPWTRFCRPACRLRAHRSREAYARFAQ